jgi:uncharacterized membrane protein YedE/YeeE
MLSGAALFGVGWGLSGLCPGPALVSVGAGAAAALWFAPAMIAGMLIFRWIDRDSSRVVSQAADDAQASTDAQCG